MYQIIEDSGNKGIWIRDIRFKSNLPNKQISKVLKTLESKKLIKSVKCVSAVRKKVYMLFDIMPDESLTGGAWYSNEQEFETEFVDVLNLKCLHYLQQKVGSKPISIIIYYQLELQCLHATSIVVVISSMLFFFPPLFRMSCIEFV